MGLDCINFNAMAGESESSDEPGADDDHSESPDEPQLVERTFTCSSCGFPMSHEARRLQWDARAICYNCGDWTLQTPGLEEMLEEARAVAEELAGATLTERQGLAYLLRVVLEVERETAAEAMESSPSNVDNLHRRAVEKVEDARRVLGSLERVSKADE